MGSEMVIRDRAGVAPGDSAGRYVRWGSRRKSPAGASPRGTEAAAARRSGASASAAAGVSAGSSAPATAAVPRPDTKSRREEGVVRPGEVFPWLDNASKRLSAYDEDVNPTG